MQNVLKTFNDLNINIKEEQIENAVRLGRRIGNRPILIKLDNARSREYILENIQKLKSINIGLSNDFTKNQLEIRRKLKDIQLTLNKKEITTKIRGTKILMRDNLYTLQEIQNWMEENNIVANVQDEDFESDGGDSTMSIQSSGSRKRRCPKKSNTQEIKKVRKLNQGRQEKSIKNFLKIPNGAEMQKIEDREINEKSRKQTQE